MVARAISPDPARLQFTDGASCRRWAGTLSLTNLQSAQQLLKEQISLVRQAGIAPRELLDVLETLREPVHFVQSELTRKYTAKPLPLEDNEIALWTRTLGLWQELTDAYIVCRDAHVRGDLPLRNRGALIVMRCLHYMANAMFEHYRIYRQAPAEGWKNLHQMYAFAEQSGFAEEPVTSTLNGEETQTSCRAAYAQALLAHLANPFALSGRQMQFVAQWIEKWSALVGLSRNALPPSAIPALCVDIAGKAGPTFAERFDEASEVRYLELEQIARTLRQTITLLKQGQSPSQLGLGDEARQPGCENLLMLLYIQWCRAGTGRSEERSANAEKAQVCLGVHAAHFYIGGRAFRTPGARLTRQEENDMQLFGHISERTERALVSAQSSAVESWELVNQSNSGFMCMQREHGAQLRIGHNQLVAVRPANGKQFQLGLVQWLRVEETSEVVVGVRLFPGMARAVLARAVNFIPPSGVNGYERALLVPEIAVPPSPATLILPTGWYQGGRFIEIFSEQKQVAKLGNLIEKGSDFDRCAVRLD